MKRKSLGKISKSEAETILHAKEVQLRTGEDILASSQYQTFKDLAIHYLDWHKFEYPDSHNRIHQITHSHLIPYFTGPSLIPPRQIENYKISRRSKVSIETVNKELRTLKAILNKGVEWEYISKNPAQYVKPLKKVNSSPPRYFSKDELNFIYNANLKYAPIWKLMVNTGLRRAEALSLRWEQVHDDKIRILSTSKDRTKSGKWRDVPISPGAREALEELNTEDYVLPQMTGTSLTRIFKNILKELGIEGSLHCLRHTFCSHLVMSGIPLRTVQILAGHSSFKTTEGYAHLSPDHLQASVVNLKL